MTEEAANLKPDLDLVETVLANIRAGEYDEAAVRTRVEEAVGAIHRLRLGLTTEDDAEFGRLEVLGLLGAGVAHELNNLLFVIRATAEMAGLSFEEGDPLATKMIRIQEAVDRAERLTRMVLFTARPGSGAPPPIQLHPMVKEGVKLIWGSLPQGIRIHQDIQTDTAAVVIDPVDFFSLFATILRTGTVALAGGHGGLSVSLGESPPDAGDERGAAAELVLTVAYTVGDIGSDAWHRETKTTDSGDTMTPDGLIDRARGFGGSIIVRPLSAGGYRYDLRIPTSNTQS